MKKILFSFMSMFFVAMVVCCDGNEKAPEEVTLKNFANSGCKGNNTRADEDGREEVVAYSVIHDGYLYLNHQNVLFNCCPGEIGANITVEGNTITIEEYETEMSCKCICPYDLSYEVGPLSVGETYTITIKRRDAEPITQKIKFTNTLSGIW